MIPKDCKRLAEVDFPIAVVSKHSAREKSIRHGHPSTLHLWWARRPLAACRSMLLALLLPDPADPLCPAEFRDQARSLLLKTRSSIADGNEALRASLLKFIGDFANWDLSSDRVSLEVARGLVKAAHPEETPLVVDPFAGGGSIPLEALRLGCDAFASDLNPVACLINKVLLEDIPRHGPELAEELRRVGAEVKQAAEKELAEYYPRDPDGARPIAYLWARTVRCEAPNCGAEIPLVRSFWLCKKADRRRALRPKVRRAEGRKSSEPPRVEFEIFTPASEKDVRGGTVSRAKATCLCCGSVLHPDRVRAQLSAQRGGADVVFDEASPGRKSGEFPQRIGGARLLAVVTLRDGQPGRHYRLPTDADYAAVWKAQQRLKQILDDWKQSRDRQGAAGMEPLPRGRGSDLCPIPDEPTPAGGGSGAGRAFSVQKYGMRQWGDLFTARQKVALTTLTRITQSDEPRPIAPTSEPQPPGSGLTAAVRSLLSISLNKTADLGNSLAPWKPDAECPVHLFARQAIPIAWDFCESTPSSDASGSFESAFGRTADAIIAISCLTNCAAQTQLASATNHPLPNEAVSCWFTDPPYYDAIPYSDLSDFFFVWLKRTLPGHPLLRDPFDPTNPLSPKLQEAVQDETKKVNGQPKDRSWFEDTMAQAFAEGRRVLREDGIGSVVFAHKTTEGWEALLGGLIRGGWTITGSWPIATEMATRLRARESAALATSVHLVCRPRPEDAPVGDWGRLLRELPKRVADWMKRLQAEGVRGADLVFACIGPALEVYSRYAKVVDAEEREIPLGGDPEATEPHRRGFLAYVWEIVGRAALEQVLGTVGTQSGVLEEDARLTALFLWTLQTTDEGEQEPRNTRTDEEEEIEDEAEETEDEQPRGKAKKGFSLPFDVVRRFAQPLGIHLNAWEGRCIETEKGVVRLISVLERGSQLFGEEGASLAADRIESTPSGPVQLNLFPDQEAAAPRVRGRRRRGRSDVPDEALETRRGATTLDRVHAAMLLQLSGRSNALRALLRNEVERGPNFVRLANALSALYPAGSDEKRLVDAMLLAVPR